MADPTASGVIGDAFVSGIHAGYLVAGAAMVASTVLAITLLQAFRRGVAVPASDAAASGAASGASAANR